MNYKLITTFFYLLTVFNSMLLLINALNEKKLLYSTSRIFYFGKILLHHYGWLHLLLN